MLRFSLVRSREVCLKIRLYGIYHNPTERNAIEPESKKELTGIY